MKITIEALPLQKRHALTISRGTTSTSNNLLVLVEQDGVTGYGEFAPVSQVSPPETALTARAQLEAVAPFLADYSPWEFQKIERLADEREMGRAAFCGLELALHDWLGKRWQVPAYRLLGADRARIVPTSVTVGINPPDVVRERTAEWIADFSPKSLKIKLGSPQGIEHDRAIFAAVKETAPTGVSLRVDANGGWANAQTALEMMRWLQQNGVEYVEQPLAKGQEDEMRAVFNERPLPIYLDESIGTAHDVARFADRTDGINLKLMKSGGIREGLRVIHTARAHGLGVMMGCMSESALAIAGSVAISSYADYLDLDSHLNLLDAPFDGLLWENGCVLPASDGAGLGVTHRNREAS
jgi:L-alanine-DL-glutamate epimerase-like enolase superfamily enzyme